MLRVALFTALVLAGSLFFETVGLLVGDKAFLLAAVLAAVLLFCIPESGKTRDPKDLIFWLVSVIAVYGIFLKFCPWLADLVGRILATAVSVLLVLAFGGVVSLVMSRPNARTHNAP